MIRHRTAEEVQRYNWFKVIILIILGLLLLVLSLSRCNSQAAVSEVPPTAVPADNSAGDTTATEPATATPVVLDAPQLTKPALAEPLIVGSAVELAGSGTPDSVVRILVNGQALETVPVGSDGLWRYTYTPEAAGELNLMLEALDEGDQVGASSETIAFTVAAPEPEIVAPTFSQPEPDLAVGEYRLTGSGTPGSTVEIEIDGEVVGTADVDEAGNWSYAADLAEPGDYRIIVRALDAGGEAVAEAGPLSITTTAPMDLLAVAAEQGMFTSLLQAVATAMLTETLQSEGPYTLLSPTDDAFAALPQGAAAALLNDEEALLRLLQHHVVDGRVDIAAAVAEGRLQTLAGDIVPVLEREDGTIQVDGAAVITPDIEADNGLLHALDGVLLPPAEIEPPLIDESGVPTFEGPLLTIVGTAEPGTTLVILINGQTFGSTTVEADGTWLVAGNVEDGEHVIVAYTLDENGIPLARSSPVLLTSPAP